MALLYLARRKLATSAASVRRCVSWGLRRASGVFLHKGERPIESKSVSLDSVDFSRSGSLFVKLDCGAAEGEIIEWVCANRCHLPPQITLASEYHHGCPVPFSLLLETLSALGFQTEHRALVNGPYVFGDRG
jgi:hypothetical protein